MSVHSTGRWPDRHRPAARAAIVGLAALLLGACATKSPEAAAPMASGDQGPGAVQQACASPVARAALAPGGVLRVAVYRGSPSSYVEASAGAPERGVGWLLGRAFAKQLDARFEPVVFANNAASLASIQQGKTDLTFTNATAERARQMRFSPPMLDVEKSVLVPAGSTIASLDALKGRAARIGVSSGSSTAEELAPIYPSAGLLPVPTLQQAGSMLGQGALDGFATNDAILFELADQVPGSKVLPGHWGLEHFALGIPQGRSAGEACVDAFAAQAAASGLLGQAVAQSRLRGTLVSAH